MTYNVVVNVNLNLGVVSRTYGVCFGHGIDITFGIDLNLFFMIAYLVTSRHCHIIPILK